MTGNQSRTVQIFFNRASGGHCDRKLAALSSSFERHGATVILSECGPAKDVVISSEASHLCAVGGDGTIRHIAAALARHDKALPISIYPTGTVNLLHRQISSPTDPYGHAVHALREAPPGLHYAVELNDTLFLACASVGPDSHAITALSARLKRHIGRMAYLVAFCRTLAAWPRQPIRLVCDEHLITCHAFYVAKGRYFAGPWSFAPRAELTRPELHVVALTDGGRLAYARFIWRMLRKQPLESLPHATVLTCTRLTAEADVPLPMQADGDIVANLPVRLQLRAEPIAFR